MYRPRIIPVLLLKGRALVKTIQFKKPLYLGDPINAVRLFNDMMADELIFLDICASQEKRCIDIGYVREIAEEANMPFSVGGGITNMQQAVNILQNGSEKVILNTSACYNPKLIRDISDNFGCQSVVVSVDVKRSFNRSYYVYVKGGRTRVSKNVIEYCHKVVDMGAGELFVQSINRDGTFSGYDLDLACSLAKLFSIPMTICGGARTIEDMVNLYEKTQVQGLAAGSLFVFQSGRDSFLINYPNDTEKDILRRDFEL